MRLEALNSRLVLAVGELDTTFNVDGEVTTDFVGTSDAATSVVVQSDGKIAVAGSANGRFSLAKYNRDGSLDTSFDGDGRVSMSAFDPVGSGASDLLLQPDGKLVAAGIAGDLTLVRFNADGSLDTTFSGDGIATATVTPFAKFVQNVVRLSDGKLVVLVGSTDTSSSWIYLVRFNANGSLDTTFDGDGIVQTTFILPTFVQPSALALQGDGKFVVTGSVNNGNSDVIVLRYNATGTLDTTFDGDGMAVSSVSSAGTEGGNAVAVQPDGKIVVAGQATGDFALLRYNTNGSLDTSFDGDGKLTTHFSGSSAVNAIAIQSDGKLTAVGINGQDFAVARYNTNGSLDTKFNAVGAVSTSLTTGADAAYDVALQADGKIVAVGGAGNNTASDFALARYDAFPTMTVTTSGGNVTITDADVLGKDNKLSVTRSANNLVISDVNEQFSGTGGIVGATLSNNDKTLTIPLTSVTGYLELATAGGNDDATLILSGGDAIPAGGLVFHGGTQSGGLNDRLFITGGSQGAVTYNHTNATDGSISLGNFGVVSYSNLESLNNDGSAADVLFNLPVSSNNSVLQDDGVIGNNLFQLISNPTTFVPTVSNNPESSLTIHRRDVANAITIRSTPDLTRPLTIGYGGSPFEMITLDGAISVTGGIRFSAATVNAAATSAANTTTGLIVNNSGDSRFAASIGGAGGLTKEGSGVLTLSGNNTYAGPTLISAGTLRLANGVTPAPAGAAVIYTFENVNGSTVNNGGTFGSAENGILVSSADTSGIGLRGSRALRTTPNVNAHLEIGASPGISLAGGNWTAAAWFMNMFDDSDWNTLFRGGVGDHQIITQTATNNLGVYDNIGGTAFRDSGYDLVPTSLSGWHHLAAVGAGTTTTFYLDGVQVGVAPFKSVTDIFSVGGYQFGGQRFAELIDDVYIYQSALAPAQITAMFNNGAGVDVASDPLPNGSSVTVAAGAVLDLSGGSETIGSLAGAGSVMRSVSGGAVLTAGANGTTTLFSGVISNGTGSVALTKAGNGVFTLGGDNTFTGPTIVTAGTLAVDGSLANGSAVTVQNLGMLSGNGSIGAVTVASGGSLAPGNLIGSLDTAAGILQTGSTLQFQFNGTIADTLYDQWRVTGAVNLGNAGLSIIGPYAPAAADSFLLIANDGTDAVAGTFAGLPEGTMVSVNGGLHWKRITYVGGSGNDVVLIPNTAPTISNIGDLSGLRNSPIENIPFTIGDAESPAAGLIVSAVSSNLTLFPPGAVTFGGGGADRTINLYPAVDQSGAATITVTAADGHGGTAVASFVVQIVVDTPHVTSFEATSTGARFTLSQAAAVAGVLNLYDFRDTAGASVMGAADVQLVGQSGGAVAGSLMVATGGTTFTFVATNGVLPPDNYTLTLRSASNGFKTSGGQLLDGNADGTVGDDFTTTFTVAAPPVNAVTVSLPSFARGPQQTANVPESSALGLPLRISSGSDLVSMTFELQFDSGLLNVTDITLAAGVTGSKSLSLLSPGRAQVTLTFTAPLTGGSQTVAYFTANVPTSAANRYGERGVLDLTNISLLASGSVSVPAIDQDAAHVNAYLGDVSRDGSYNSFDVQQVSRAAVGLDTGYQQHLLLDPRIISDFDGSAGINSFDVQRVSRLAVGLSIPEAPPLPVPPVTVNSTGNLTAQESIDKPTTPPAGSAPQHNAAPGLRSDVDNDGIIDAQDILWAVFLYNQSLKGSPSSLAATLFADVNCDNQIDPSDILFAVSDFNLRSAGEGEAAVVTVPDAAPANENFSETLDDLDSLAYLLATDWEAVRKTK